jgi:hypothetical protein
MSSTEKTLAFGWIASNTLGWVIAIETMGRLGGGLGAWIACGAIVGVAQWLALHRRLHLAPAWIAGTCFAWAVGNWAGYAHGFFVPDPYWAGVAGGTLAGLAQASVLWRQVSRPALWVPAAIVSSTLGWIAGTYIGICVYDSHAGERTAYLAGGAVGGAVIGAVSAPILLAMLRHPKARPEAA